MARANVLAAGWMTLSMMIGPGVGNAQERPMALKELVARLDAAGHGAGGWRSLASMSRRR